MSNTRPYPGLRHFRRNETDIFFGREEQIDRMLEKLDEKRFLAVVGPSGCGKSSLVKAGMISALETGFMLSAGARWKVVEIRPGSHPIKRLAVALSEVFEKGWGKKKEDAVGFLNAILRRGPLSLIEVLLDNPLPENTNLLVVVDQFEEIFRYSREVDEDEADAFVALLVETVKKPDMPVYVVITMRTDFLDDCAIFSGLPETINEGQFLTPRLTWDQCREAIVGPARVCSGDVEPALVNRILNDMGTDPDQLPLMQHLLMRMWTFKINPEKRKSGLVLPEAKLSSKSKVILTIDDYDAAGGLAKALSKHADVAFNSLIDEKRRIAEVLFRCLSERGSDNRAIRRPQKVEEVAEVAVVPAESVIEVVEVFRDQDNSFITPPLGEKLYPSTVLDISHESLIRQWEQLREWVVKENKMEEFFRDKEGRAQAWTKYGDRELLEQPHLQVAIEQMQDYRGSNAAWAKRYNLNYELTIRFLEASEENYIVKKEAELAKKTADDKRRAQKLKKEREAKRRFKIATFVAGFVALLAIGATIGALLMYRQAEEATITARNAEEKADMITKKANTQNSVMLINKAFKLLEQTDNNVTMLSKKEVKRNRELSALLARLAFRFACQTDNWDIMSRSTDLLDETIVYLPGTHQKTFLNAPSDFTGESYTAIALSKDGKFLAAARHYEIPSAERRFLPSKDRYKFNDIDIIERTSDGRPNIQILRGLDATVLSLAFSPDDNMLASGGADNVLTLWKFREQEPKPQKLLGHTDSITSVAFDRSGERLASGSADRTVRLWDTNSGEQVKAHIELASTISYLQFHPQKNALAFGSANGTVYLWDLDRENAEHYRVKDLQKSVKALAFSNDLELELLASGHEDKAIVLWNLKNSARLKVLKTNDLVVYPLAFNTGGLHAGSHSWDLSNLNDENWDTFEFEPQFTGDIAPQVNIVSAAFSGDGSVVVALSAGVKPINWHTRRMIMADGICSEVRDFSKEEIVDQGLEGFFLYENNKEIDAISCTSQAEPTLKPKNELLQAKAYISTAKEKVLKGDGESALEEFKKAKELDPLLEPEIKKEKISSSKFLRYQSEKAAIDGDAEKAKTLFQQALKLDPGLETAIDRDAEERKYVALAKLQAGIKLAAEGKITEAIKVFEGVEKDYTVVLKIAANEWNQLCTKGNQLEQYEEAKSACEKAVKLDNTHSGYKFNWSIARAATADTKKALTGAIDDLKKDSGWIQDMSFKAQVDRWILELSDLADTLDESDRLDDEQREAIREILSLRKK